LFFCLFFCKFDVILFYFTKHTVLTMDTSKGYLSSFFARYRYRIEAERITVWPNYHMRFVAHILLVVFLSMSLMVWMMAGALLSGYEGAGAREGWRYLMSLPAFLAIPWGFPLMFVAIYTVRVEFDIPSQTIFRRHLFGKKRLGSFAGVSEVTEVNHPLPAKSGYWLHFSDDPYGTGVVLTRGFRNAREKEPFKTQLIPALEAVLFRSERVTPPALPPRRSEYIEHESRFTTRRQWGGAFFYWTFAAAFGGLYGWQALRDNPVWWFWALALVFFLAGLYEPTRKRTIDTGRKLFRTCCFWGLWRRVRRLEEGVDLYLFPEIRRVHYEFRRTGVEVWLRFPDGRKFLLRRFRNRRTKAILPFLRQTAALLERAGVKDAPVCVDPQVRLFKN
jgi:hypothetical protein